MKNNFKSLKNAAVYARRKAIEELEEELEPAIKKELKKEERTTKGDPYSK